MFYYGLSLQVSLEFIGLSFIGWIVFTAGFGLYKKWYDYLYSGFSNKNQTARTNAVSKNERKNRYSNKPQTHTHTHTGKWLYTGTGIAYLVSKVSSLIFRTDIIRASVDAQCTKSHVIRVYNATKLSENS